LLLKRIAINGRFLSQSVTGVQRYARELLRELDCLLVASLPKGADPVEVLVPKNAGAYPSYKSLLIKEVGTFTGQAWEQIELPIHCRGKLLFTPCGGAPVLHDCHVVTIPDAAVFATPEAYSPAYRTWYRWLHTRMGRAARRVITVSEFSKSELVRLCGIAPSRVSITHLGCDHLTRLQPDCSILDELRLESFSYVLAVSSRNPNKNFQGLVRAMNLLGNLPVSFVIAGSMNAQVFSRSEPIPPSVIQVGNISDEQLRALYEHAGCFVFPSRYEGFGLPPLEAMASGCPVIVGEIGALRETCGNAALFCNPAEPLNIADQIAVLMKDGNLRRTLIERGNARSQDFRWAKTALETWKILELVAADS
jgi:glycosyltransferase involved in cell wall biosynthesis